MTPTHRLLIDTWNNLLSANISIRSCTTGISCLFCFAFLDWPPFLDSLAKSKSVAYPWKGKRISFHREQSLTCTECVPINKPVDEEVSSQPLDISAADDEVLHLVTTSNCLESPLFQQFYTWIGLLLQSTSRGLSDITQKYFIAGDTSFGESK